MKIKLKSIIFILNLLSFPSLILGQEAVVKNSNSNDISNVSEAFETAFYEALSCKLIQNYDKAILKINECISIDNTKSILFFELAQNQIGLKQYSLAQKNLELVSKKMPNNELVLDKLHEIYFLQQQYNQSILTLKKLTEIHPKYKLDLAKVYLYTQQYANSLNLLNEYQNQFGYDDKRVEQYRNRIYANSKDKGVLIIDLEKKLQKNHNDENAYIKLIDLYNSIGKPESAKQTFIRFEKQMPQSPLLDYVRFENCLKEGNTIKATELLQKITNNNNVPNVLKEEALNQYRIYGKQNPNYKEEIKKIPTSTLAQENNLKFFMEISSFQIKEGSTESLLEVYQKNLNIDPNNFDLIKDTLLLQLYYGKIENATELVKVSLEKYPSQPLLYLINGVLLSKKLNHKKAISSFEEGLDYIVDDQEMERALYLKLAASYKSIGAIAKATKYQNKGEKIPKQ